MWPLCRVHNTLGKGMFALGKATLGKEVPSKSFMVKAALPSAESRALGKGLLALGKYLTSSIPQGSHRLFF
jgi:hypothetical protein